MLVSFLLALVVVIAVPSGAEAWGPITHLTHGAELLENLTIASVALQRLLRRHRLEFLYGCIGADITQAKKYTRAEQAHCHSWEIGWAVMERAESDRERAFAYGYLTHLVGDVYSHNHYVPTQLIVSFRSRTLRHIYWEARFDTMQKIGRRSLVREMRRQEFPECDALVERAVSRTLFPFTADKRIFNYFIAIHDLDQWHQIMSRLSAQSRYSLSDDLVRQYNAACHAGVADVMVNGRQADCQSADPTGEVALRRAHRTREGLRLLRRQGKLSDALLEQISLLDVERELALPCCRPLPALA